MKTRTKHERPDLVNCSEREVIEIWRLLNREELATEDGEPIKVLYPGRPNDDRGADFRDAVIRIRRGLVKGDVEVHTKLSDWWAHGHHKDPLYERVVLHVVMWNDSGVMTGRQNGVPVLALEKYVNNRAGSLSDVGLSFGGGSAPCSRAPSIAPNILTRFLDDAGEKRFLDKAAGFQAELITMDAGQCFYRGLMGALGYAKNKPPFLELADKVPLQLLESISRSGMAEEQCIVRMQALLLGTAGLLLSQRHGRRCDVDDEWMEKLEKAWLSMKHGETMSYDFNLFKVRPGNFPVRRIAAVSYLVWRYREAGIFNAVVNMVRDASGDCSGLEKGLMVIGDGYWASHFDFGLSAGERERALIGDRRAADIVVNVVLPSVYAGSKVGCHLELGAKAFELYCNYPRLAVNSIEKHMCTQLGLSNRLINSARRQQGLIHIYKTLCTQGKCDECPLSQLQAGDGVQV